MIVMCHCWFMDCNKGTTLVQDVDGEGGYVCVHAKCTRTLYFPLNFTVNLKPLQKIIYFFKSPKNVHNLLQHIRYIS